MYDSVDLPRLLYWFDIFAVIVFAVSGSLVASRKRLDVMGFMWLAVVTGVGGGTIRDVILDVPVFWVLNPVYMIVCLATATVMHVIAPLVESRHRILLWFDAFGLSLVTVAGTVKALDAGTPALVAIVMGVVTWCVGGIIRDTLGQVPSILLRHEIYVTASALGACTYAGLEWGDGSRSMSMMAGFAMTFVVRSLAIAFGWSLPVFRGSTQPATGWRDR